MNKYLVLLIGLNVVSLYGMDSSSSTSQSSPNGTSKNGSKSIIRISQPLKIAVGQWKNDPLHLANRKNFAALFAASYKSCEASQKEPYIDALGEEIDCYQEDSLKWFMMRTSVINFAREQEIPKPSISKNGSEIIKKPIVLPYQEKELKQNLELVSEFSKRAGQKVWFNQFPKILTMILKSYGKSTYKQKFVAEISATLSRDQRRLETTQKLIFNVFKEHGLMDPRARIPATRNNNICMLLGEAQLAIEGLQKPMDNSTLESIGTYIRKTLSHYCPDRGIIFITFLAKFCNEQVSIEKNKKIIKDIVFNYILGRIDTYKNDEPDDLLQVFVRVFPFSEYDTPDRKLLLAVKDRGRLDAIKDCFPDLDKKWLQNVDEFNDDSESNRAVKRLSVVFDALGMDPHAQNGDSTSSNLNS